MIANEHGLYKNKAKKGKFLKRGREAETFLQIPNATLIINSVAQLIESIKKVGNECRNLPFVIV